jgi:hypothetical protein
MGFSTVAYSYAEDESNVPVPPPPTPDDRYISSTVIFADPLENTLVVNSGIIHLKSDTIRFGGAIGVTRKLAWDDIGSRFYETGLDRGVLYLDGGYAVPWNGLTSVVESSNKEVEPVYFDGMKINTLVSVGEYSATIKAFTYPDELEELDGAGKIMSGVFLGNQSPQMFDLSYRTLIGKDTEPDFAYKIHILYNVMAVSKDKTYETLTKDSSFSEFEWDISTVAEDIDGFSPTAHIVINSKDFDPWFLEEIENILYGSATDLPTLPSLPDLITYLRDLAKESGTVLISIVDNGDGTWTASTDQDALIVVDSAGFFEIFDATATLTGDSYTISDTTIL